MMLRTALTVFLAALLAIAGFAFFVPHANKGGEEAPLSIEIQTPIPSVFLTDSYKKGVHTFTGSIEAPTPCTEVVAEGRVASSTPERITIAVTMPSDTSICLQQITALPFKVTLSATADATVEVTVNGEVASTTMKKI